MEVSKLENPNLKDACRLCLKTAGRKIGIFEEEGQLRQIAYKIRSSLPVLIYPGDPLPQYICPACLVKLESCFEFLQKYMKNSRILRNALLKDAREDTPQVEKYFQLVENIMRRPAIYPSAHARPQEDDLRSGIAGQEEDIGWQPPEALIDAGPQEEIFGIFLPDGPRDKFLPESDDLDFFHQGDDQCGITRNEQDTIQQNPEAVTSVENIPANASQPTAECNSSAIQQILGTIKQEPQEAEEREIEVTWLTQSTEQEEDALDINKVKVEPVPLSLAVIKQEQPEQIISATNHHNENIESLISSTEPQTRSSRINVECSKCLLVLHTEVEILGHRCIGISPWYCEPCNRYYKSKETFSRHKRYFCCSGEIPCLACDSVFPNRIQLAHHQMVHLSIKMKQLDVSRLNTCKVCRQTFISKGSLNMHERSHLKMNERSRYLNSPESNISQILAIPENTETHSEIAHSSSKNMPDVQCVKMPGKAKNQYHCTVCKSWFNNQKAFMAHNRQHGLKNVYKHKHSLTLKIAGNKEQHQRVEHTSMKSNVSKRQHSSANRYACIICRVSFISKPTFLEHKKLHTPARKALESDVSKRQHSSGNRYACMVCHKSYLTIKAYLQHKELHTPARKALDTRPFSAFTTGNGTVPVSEWVCKICGLDCRQSTILWNHVREKHSRMSYKCSHCPKMFGKLCSLKSHEKTHEPKLRCTACGKQYSTLKALAAHEQNKHISPHATHLCRKCNIKFDTRSALLIHARNHQSLPKLKKNLVSVSTKSPSSHTCPICARTFSRYDSLKRHECVHSTGKHSFYPCSVCGLKLMSVPSYKAHTERHFQEMEKTQCSTCKRTYFTEDFSKHFCVKRQLLTSTSEANAVKKFKCELCASVFGTQQARNSHMRVHRKNWKYSAKRMAKTTPAVKKPAQNHGEISYSIYCPLCSKAFLTKGELQHHVKLHHSKK